MKKIKLTIEGMHCASCASNVERSLKKVKGVKEASVSIMTKKAIIETEENVNQDEIKKAVEKTGFKLTEVNNG